MHILHVACMPYPSMQGSQVYLRGLMKAQAQRHKVSLLCYGHGTECTDHEYQVYRVPNILGYDRVRAGPDRYKPLLDLMLMIKLWNLDADVIHVHNYEAPIAAYLSKMKHKVPIVYTAHNLMEEELETYFTHRWAKSISRRFGKWLDTSIPRRADAVVTIRKRTESILRELGCRYVVTIPPGVEKLDITSVHPLDRSVVYAGNVDAYQNLELFYKLAQKMPETLFRIVTSDDVGLPKDLPQNIEVIVLNNFQKICEQMLRSKVCIVPRKDCSGFPMKVLNAIALGIPVVAFSSAISEIPGVARCQDSHEMEQVLRRLLEDSQYCDQLGKQGKEHILSEYSWEKRAIEVEKIYNYLNQ